MKLAIVGKGGSGKSSISWLLARYFSLQNKVLAIDADYNMDLMHNLKVGVSKDVFLKKSEQDLYNTFNVHIEENAFKILEKNDKEVFRIFPNDTFTEKYSYSVYKNLQLMVLGDHDVETMYSGRCGHAYAKSIKFYVPFLSLEKKQMVIIDSVAGTDMINYGLFLGVDALCCVVEDTPNSVLVMSSAKKIAEEYGIPFYAILNKSQGKELKYISKDDIAAEFYFDPALSEYKFENVSDKNLLSCQIFEKFLNDIPTESTIHRLGNWKKAHDAFIA